MATFHVEYIEWIDAASMKDSGWKTENELREFLDERWVISEVGFVAEENKEYLCLIGGFNLNHDEYELTIHRDLKIPVKCIVRRVRLKLPKKK